MMTPFEQNKQAWIPSSTMDVKSANTFSLHNRLPYPDLGRKTIPFPSFRFLRPFPFLLRINYVRWRLCFPPVVFRVATAGDSAGDPGSLSESILTLVCLLFFGCLLLYALLLYVFIFSRFIYCLSLFIVFIIIIVYVLDCCFLFGGVGF